MYARQTQKIMILGLKKFLKFTLPIDIRCIRVSRKYIFPPNFNLLAKIFADLWQKKFSVIH